LWIRPGCMQGVNMSVPHRHHSPLQSVISLLLNVCVLAWLFAG